MPLFQRHHQGTIRLGEVQLMNTTLFLKFGFREAGGILLVVAWLSISMMTSFTSAVHPLGVFNWCIISACIMTPLVGSLLLYMTINPDVLPQHCKGVIQGVHNITHNLNNIKDRPYPRV